MGFMSWQQGIYNVHVYLECQDIKEEKNKRTRYQINLDFPLF